RRAVNDKENNMLGKSLIGALATLAALWFAIDAAAAFDDSKYPNLKGQWVRARIPVPGGGQAPFDPTKPVGRGQQAPLTPEYQKIFEANPAEHATGSQRTPGQLPCPPGAGAGRMPANSVRDSRGSGGGWRAPAGCGGCDGARRAA